MCFDRCVAQSTNIIYDLIFGSAATIHNSVTITAQRLEYALQAVRGSSIPKVLCSGWAGPFEDVGEGY